MKVALLFLALFFTSIAAFQPIFGQTFTTLFSYNEGIDNSTWFFDFDRQVDLTYALQKEYTRANLYEFTTQIQYSWMIIDGQTSDCQWADFDFPTNMSKFTWPGDLVWFGWEVVNGFECNEYLV
jgi:hypothetical protein